MKKKSLKAALVASAVAGVFVVVGCGSPTNNTNTSTQSIKCEGGNACCGKGECKTATHECAGQGKCAGQGWINVKDEAACTAAKEAAKKAPAKCS